MRTPTPSDDFSKAASLSDSLLSGRIERRDFIRNILVAGIGVASLASSTKLVSAQQFDDADAWRSQVQGFVNAVFDPRRARDINSQIQDISMGRAPVPSDIHSTYSAPWVFTGATIGTVRVICDNGFALDQFPLYDAQCPCRNGRDLNAAEIASITSPFETSRLGCVVTPNSARMPVEYNDHAEVSELIRSVYNRNPNNFRIHYKRHFTTHRGRRHTAYYASDNARLTPQGQPEKTLFVGPEDI
jgi:hypothetical protein